ncbi:MAG: GH32 C-terminal domain-containing protein, partial [Thermoguttaceae bacterium]|nr:GH32 C-terminal domain-containing protein [Thermoguttaceae bacterium]
VVAPLSVVDGRVSLRVVLDRTSIEIFANDGLSQIAKCFVPADKNDAPVVEFYTEVAQKYAKKLSCETKLDVYPMRSVWNAEK